LYDHLGDADLLKAVAKKDTEAFKTFMKRYQGRVFRTVYRYTGDTEISRDLVQDIFVKVYRAAGSYTPDAELFTWLYRIIANHCINFLKQQKRDPLYEAEDTISHDRGLQSEPAKSPNQQTVLEKQELAVSVRRALDSLPERQKMAITMLRFEGLSYREIAKVLGCSVSAVESLIFRGMESLKQLLSTEKAVL